jgi:hypothetical protein
LLGYFGSRAAMDQVHETLRAILISVFLFPFGLIALLGRS